MSLAFAQPTEWWLEIPSDIQTQCWQESQTIATATRRQAVYLNQLCLRVFLPWFQQDYDPATLPWPQVQSLPSIWEVVGGTGLVVGSKRLVILPRDTLDTDGLDVPQEWVDIPEWAADYYLAIQVDLENRCLRVWGYTTHQTLKQRADYDPCDRTYCLPGHRLNRDLNAFWTTYQLCPDADTQATVSPLPILSDAQAQQTIQQLSRLGSAFPRLALPFERWGAILHCEGWRQQLYQSRLAPAQDELAEEKTNLGQWLNDLFADEWRSLEAFLGAGHPALAHNLRRAKHDKGFCAPRVKFVTLNVEPAPQTVALLMVLNTESDGRLGVRVQVHPAVEDNQHIPPELVLSIYSQDDEVLQSVQARAQENYMRLPHFRCFPGTQFRLQITLSNDTFSETFSV